MTAPAGVLALLPGVDEGIASQILGVRKALEADATTNTAWLYTRNLVDADAFKLLAPKLTTRGYQYHILCVGFGMPSGRYRVLEAVVDFSGTDPKVIYLRDLTRLGLPFALSVSQ